MKERDGWTFLSGDVNYVEHGGMFLYKASAMIGHTNMDRTTYIVADWSPLDIPRSDEQGVCVMVRAVCPEWLDKEVYASVRDYCDLDENTYGRSVVFTSKGTWKVKTPEEVRHAIIDATARYGAAVTIGFHKHYSMPSKEVIENLWKSAEDEARQLLFLAGFILDRQMNHLGATGWDLIRGRIIPKQPKRRS